MNPRRSNLCCWRVNCIIKSCVLKSLKINSSGWLCHQFDTWLGSYLSASFQFKKFFNLALFERGDAFIWPQRQNYTNVKCRWQVYGNLLSYSFYISFCLKVKIIKFKPYRDFPGGAVVKNPPANAGDMGLSPGPGRSHMPRSN